MARLRNAVIFVEPGKVPRGYVMPGCKGEVDIQKAIADFFAEVIRDANGIVEDCDTDEGESQTCSDCVR